MISLPSDLVTTSASYYIYGLFAQDRRQSLFYIGRGVGRRMFRHFNKSEQIHNFHKDRVIKKYVCYAMPLYGGLTLTMANKLETALIALLAKRLTNKAPGGAGGSRKAVSALDKRLAIKVDLNFVAYHMWAYEISGLSLAEYVKIKPFTFGAFSDWRSKRFKHLSNCNNKAGPSKLNKKRHQFKYSLEFIATTIKLFKKSKLSQQNFANILGIPRATLNNFIIKARDSNHPLYKLITL